MPVAKNQVRGHTAPMPPSGMSPEDSIAGVVTIVLAIFSIAGFYRAKALPTFSQLLLNRWLRWLLFGIGLAYLFRSFGWSDRPYWAFAPSLLLMWILLESIYTWVAVRALSHSPIPVYPNYRDASDEKGWPVDPAFLQAREEIRKLEFHTNRHLIADLGGGIVLRSLLYLNQEKNIRLQVLFVPRAVGNPMCFYTFSSRTEKGVIATDNVSLPFGGVCPQNWYHMRKPFVSSVTRLFQLHQRHIQKTGDSITQVGEDLLDDLNEEQEKLDQESTERGILLPKSMRAEEGKLTSDGRYRIWKQILLLNYFGKVGTGK